MSIAKPNVEEEIKATMSYAAQTIAKLDAYLELKDQFNYLLVLLRPLIIIIGNT